MAEKRKPQSGLEWLNQNYGMGPLNELLGLAGGFGRNTEQVINRAGGYSTPSGLTPEQQKSLADSVNGEDTRVARIKQESDALVDAARKDPNHRFHNLFTQQGAVVSDDSDPRQSALTAMRQQYAPGSKFFETDAGQRMIEQAKNNRYEGDAAGLAEFNMNQRKVGIGAIDEIVDAMGYAGTPMEDWARANENLALREYNKKYGNYYEGTGPSDEEIKAAIAKGVNTEDGGYFAPEGSPNPLGETGGPRESNTAQTAQMQPAAMQAINTDSLSAIDALMSPDVKGLKGKRLFEGYANRLYGAN